jgi:hypothetical protein
MFFSYFLLEISTLQDIQTRSIQKVPSTKRALLNAAKNLKIKHQHHEGNEKKIAQLVTKKLDALYRK